jgi:glycosyltransferase involved in cell wall biosynthesis
MEPPFMHIGINALSFIAKQAGTSTYVNQLLREFAAMDTGHSFTAFIPTGTRALFATAPHIRYIQLPVPQVLIRIIIEQLLLPILATVLRCNILHSVDNSAPLLMGRKNLVTVHDIYYIHFPQRFTFWKRNYLRIVVRLGVAISRAVITVSRCTRDDLMNHYHVKSSAIGVIYEGCKPLADCRDITVVRRNYSITAPYFLFVGTLEPGKNLLRLITAFQSLAADFQLVIVGRWWKRYRETFRHVESLGLTGRVIFTEYAPDAELGALYRNAVAFVLPSLHEGFGLPIIEAMDHGCPVCCSNTSCLPEIARDAALFFDPYDPDSIAAAMQTIITPAVRNDLITRGRSRAKGFTWRKCAEQTLLAYNALAARQALPIELTTSAQ